MAKLLSHFVANVFDIYPTDDFLSLFVKDNSLDIDAILDHPFINHSLSYSFLWNLVYKTYPTKRDFQNYLNANNLLHTSSVNLDHVFLDRVLNSFFPLKLGLFGFFNAQEIFKQFDAYLKELNNISFKTSFICSKWKHRYNLTEDEFLVCKGGNLLVTFSNILKAYKPVDLPEDPRHNPISKNTIDSIEFVEKDKKYLNHHERVQYTIMKDNHFLMKLIGNACILVDLDINDDMLAEITRHYKGCRVVFINYKGSAWDPCFCFDVPSNIYNLIPRISKHFLAVSNKKHPEFVSLSLARDKAIYYLFGTALHNEDSFAITTTYDRYIVSDLRNLPLKSRVCKYVVFPFVKNIPFVKHDKCPRVWCPPKTFPELKNMLPECSLNEEHESYDFFVDFYNEEDPLLHMANGSIPVVKEHSVLVVDGITGFYVSEVNKTLNLIEGLMKKQPVIDKIRENCLLFRALCNRAMVDSVWKSHVGAGCPMRSISPMNGILLYLNFLYPYFCKKIEDIAAIGTYNEKSPYKAVIIDNRPNPLSVLSVLFTMANLDQNWSPVVYTSSDAIGYYKEMLGNIASIVHWPDLDVKDFHIDIYNNILKSPAFWRSVNAEKCLIIQDDGVLLKKGIDRFMEFDYIGASWADCEGNEYIKSNINSDLVGNGGFSLRTVPKSIEACELFEEEKRLLFYKNINQIPEDVYSVYCMKKLGANMPSFEQGTAFASEEICNYDSIGIHKMWVYQMGEITQRFFNRILEA